ncbi:hypothetical protein ACIP79_19260 [Streptomyces sp. NPDC088747]|uniref:hypothetical protein n=1 Tax=Streptomyces sp. NPDC088747 TaxID=3365886 RepID=UPI0038199A04
MIAVTGVQEREPHWWYRKPVVIQVSQERGFSSPTQGADVLEIHTGVLHVGVVETVGRLSCARSVGRR